MDDWQERGGTVPREAEIPTKLSTSRVQIRTGHKSNYDFIESRPLFLLKQSRWKQVWLFYFESHDRMERRKVWQQLHHDQNEKKLLNCGRKHWRPYRGILLMVRVCCSIPRGKVDLEKYWLTSSSQPGDVCAWYLDVLHVYGRFEQKTNACIIIISFNHSSSLT